MSEQMWRVSPNRYSPLMRAGRSEPYWRRMFETATMRRTPAERMNSHWFALGQPRRSQRPSGDHDTSEKDPAPAKPPQKSRVAVRLEALKVEERLRKLRDEDPDRSVRDAARQALARLAGVQGKKP